MFSEVNPIAAKTCFESIPEGWKTRTISQLADIYLGGTPKTNVADYWNGPIEWVTAKDVSNARSRFVLSTERTITQKGTENSPSKVLPANTIIITARGVGVGDIRMLSKPMAFNQTCYGLKAKAINDVFLFYKLKSILGQIRRFSYGTVFTTITMKTFDQIEVAVPVDKREQLAIAKILSALDSRIELNQQVNKTLESIAQAIFKCWFVDFEFPNEESKPYKSSGGEMVYNEELDKEIPARWQVKPIDEIADFLNGLALQKFPARDGEAFLPVVKIRELRQGITESSDKANLDLPKEYIVNDGDVLFSWSGSLEVVIWGSGRGALNQHLFKVASSKYPKWLFYHWIIEYLPQYRQIAADKATTMGHIQRHHLRNSLVAVPDDETLDRMDRVLSPIFDKLVLIRVETRTLSQIRDSLLPKLMSGKIRVPVSKENVEA